jgi:hypothetical protein
VSEIKHSHSAKPQLIENSLNAPVANNSLMVIKREISFEPNISRKRMLYLYNDN